MNAHSPAPWRVEDTHPDHACLYINSDPGMPGDVAVLYGIDGALRAADARLIAAAPDLLDVLREAELVLAEKLRRLGAEPHVSPTYNRIRDVIAKAMGGAA